ncbi:MULTISPECIES: MBL fold metallo-hydrolase [unclassified Knoellia]|uniref:MBL fold metallo-hydrolase n=1 Tax=Knoellia altitudinis TaxID=3404795 RepID=UPI003614610E
MSEAPGYTGDVSSGDATQVRELDHLVIRKVAVSEMSNNAYLLTCRATGEQLLVDAADDPGRLRTLVREGTGSLEHLVTTHQHWDHVRALPDLVEAFHPRTYAGRDDAEALPVRPDVLLAQGDRITVGQCELDVVHLRGHTPGSVALAYGDPAGHTHLFTGDSLFPGGVGATTRYEYQSFDSLIEDVTTRVFDVYDDDTWVYPGHGGDTTLGAERPHLTEWRDRGW